MDKKGIAYTYTATDDAVRVTRTSLNNCLAALSESEAENAALREALREPEGWQPIETAPKDNTVIDLWAGRRFPECVWSKRLGCWWWRLDHLPGCDGGRYLPNEPTHWMPLPAAPTGDAPDVLDIVPTSS